MIQHTTHSNVNQTLAAQQTHSASHHGQNAPTHEEIAKRAYEIYVKKGRKQGQCAENWRQAEQNLRSQAPASKTFPSR